jgi:hypothetical protein
MNPRTQRIMPRQSDMATALLLLAGACAGGATSRSTAAPAPAKELSGVATDSTALVRQDGFELSLRLAPAPRKVGDYATVWISVRNTGNAAREVVVSHCSIYSRGVRVAPSIECLVGSGPITLQPGETWSNYGDVGFEGPPGRHRFEVEAIIDPEAWVGLDLELAAE